MNNRIAATIAAVALTLGALFVAGPAVADDADPAPVCHTYPGLPDECLSQEAVAYILNLRGLYNGMLDAYQDQAAETQRQALMVTEEFTEKNQVLYRLAQANLRITALRAKVKELRQIIHS